MHDAHEFLSVKLISDLMAQAKSAARNLDIPLNDFINLAISEKLNGSNKGQHEDKTE